MAKDKSMKGHVLFSQVDKIVEQQTEFVDLKPINPVVNPLRPDYSWDVDDNWSAHAQGRMRAGETFRFERHFVADNQGHLFHLSGNFMKRRSFILKLSIPEIGFEYQEEFENFGRVCLLGPSYNISDHRLLPIEGSNGGVGIKAIATFEIKALDSHSISITLE